ncbi:MAG: hypothetical protein K5636_01995 [Bacteroidales bacterium]|nr:hypothetical protein [Bacteroidales bacterium]
MDLRIRKGDTDKLFYVHPDRPGSNTHITDETLKQQPCLGHSILLRQ